jgi:hypothetical protein
MNNRDQILTDDEFWTRLEFESSHWLELSEDKALRSFWVDGFIRELARNTKRGLDVQGVAWVGQGGRMQWQFQFIVSLPQKMLSRRNPKFHIENLELDVIQKTLFILLRTLDK